MVITLIVQVCVCVCVRACVRVCIVHVCVPAHIYNSHDITFHIHTHSRIADYIDACVIELYSVIILLVYIYHYNKCQWLLRINVTHSSNTSTKTDNGDNCFHVPIHTNC